MEPCFTKYLHYVEPSLTKYLHYVEPSLTKYLHYVEPSFTKYLHYVEPSFTKYLHYVEHSFTEDLHYVESSFTEYLHYVEIISLLIYCYLNRLLSCWEDMRNLIQFCLKKKAEFLPGLRSWFFHEYIIFKYQKNIIRIWKND